MGAAMAVPRLAAGESGEMRVLLEEAPPYAYPGLDGKPHGYSVELSQELLARVKASVQLEFDSWARIYRRGQSEPNVLIPLIARLREREPLFHWVGVSALRQGYLFRLRGRSEVKVSDLASAKAYSVAVIKDDVAERELLAQGFDRAHLDRSGDYAALLRKFFARRVDLFAMNAAAAPSLLQLYGYDAKLVEPMHKFSEVSLYVAASLSTPMTLRQSLDAAWESMRRDGTVGRLAAMYPIIAPV